MRSFGVTSFAIALLLAVPVCGHAQVTDIVQGYMSGRTAGDRPNVTLPWGVSTGTITLLTALDNEPVTNNRVVRAAVVNAALGAGVSWAVNRLLRPDPSPITNKELRRSTEAYQEGFRRGFNESLGSRQMVSNLLGVITGSVIAGTIYMVRKD